MDFLSYFGELILGTQLVIGHMQCSLPILYKNER